MNTDKYFLLILLFLHENIRCGYSLEVPCQATPNEYPQHTVCFFREIRKISNFSLENSTLSGVMYEVQKNS